MVNENFYKYKSSNDSLEGLPAGSAKRIEWSSLVFLVGLAAWSVTAAYLQRPFVGDFVDDGQYLVSARSLCDLGGYRLPSRPGAPVATKYPMGSPVIAAVVMALLPGRATTTHDWLAGKIVVICAGVILAVASRRFLILSGLSLWAAGLLSLAVVWHPGMTQLTATLMSDVPYAAISTVLLVRWVRRTCQVEVSATAWAVDGILAGAGWLIRGNGVTLVVAAFAASASIRRPYRYWPTVAVLAGVACTWLPAAVYMRTMLGPRDTGNYATELEAAYKAAGSPWSLPIGNIARIPEVLITAIASPTAWSSPIASAISRRAALRWLTYITALGLLTLGVKRLIAQNTWPRPVWIHASLTLLVFVLWHHPMDNRFTLPLVPMVLAACALGLDAATAGRVGTIAFSAITTTASLLMVCGIVVPRAIPHGGVMGGGQNPSIVALFEAIRTSTPQNAVIISANPELVYLNTGRIAAPLRDDALLFSRNTPTWEGLSYWIRLAGDRPVYLLDAPVLIEDPVGNIGPLLRGGRVGPEPIALGSEGRLWRVERRAEP